MKQHPEEMPAAITTFMGWRIRYQKRYRPDLQSKWCAIRHGVTMNTAGTLDDLMTMIRLRPPLQFDFSGVGPPKPLRP